MEAAGHRDVGMKLFVGAELCVGAEVYVSVEVCVDVESLFEQRVVCSSSSFMAWARGLYSLDRCQIIIVM